MTDVPCALCGDCHVPKFFGRTGCACHSCIGEAAKQMLCKQHVPDRMTVTASDRCLLCGEPITSGLIAAARGPYRLCHSCVISALDAAVPIDTATFIQVNF